MHRFDLTFFLDVHTEEGACSVQNYPSPVSFLLILDPAGIAHETVLRVTGPSLLH